MQPGRRKAKSQSLRHKRLAIETLERREMLSADAPADTPPDVVISELPQLVDALPR